MKTKIILATGIGLAALALGTSCSSIPKLAVPVNNFDAGRYLGTWYEIARFDYRFEKNLDNVTARYTQMENGEIGVMNMGYNYKTNEWKSARGIAKFRRNKQTAALKVSFFKPFYAGYNVIAIDEDYRYALVAGKNLKYLWLLSREKTMPDPVKDDYLKKAEAIGYDTTKLIWVKQDKDQPSLNP